MLAWSPSASDTGSGISPEEQQSLFAAFQQGEAGAQHGGTGLGLTISQKQLALMDSQLDVDSTVGKGSRFSFGLHLPQAEGTIKSEV